MSPSGPLRGGRALTRALSHVTNTGTETDEAEHTDTSVTRPPGRLDGDKQSEAPTLSHRLRHDSSILAIALSAESIYVGTQGGEIVVYALDTFKRKAIIHGHRGSVLGLCLSQDQTLLFSSAGDRIVNVWKTKDLSRSCCLYSSYDVGDIFCVAYSENLQTVFLGAQNTSIQWFNQKDGRSHQSTSVLPNLRHDRFFDSSGPGGIRTPRPAAADIVPRHAKGGEVIEISNTNVKHFAHYGYVYCMLLARDGVLESAGREVLITGGGDGVIKVWRLDAHNGGAIEELYSLDDGREQGHSILSIAFEGTFLYSGRSGGELDVWDLETRQLLRNIKAHRDDVLTVCVGGGYLFSAAFTGYVRQFDKQYQLKSRFQAHEGRILASAFTLYNHRAIYVTGGNDNTLAVWDVSASITSPTVSLQTSNERLVESLRRFVSYRTVSSDQKNRADCRRGASYLRSVFKNFGAATEMLPTTSPFNPVILARFRGNPSTASKRKKILFYGHYDVVAANNENGKWLVDPFTMEGIDGFLYGRGTSDNKGPIMAAIYACAELMSEQALGSDIIFLIEGEEECGSRGFEQAVRASKDKIGDVDWILLANSYWLDDRIPCLTYGLRGVIHATVQVESDHPDLHSGVDGSAQLDESLKDLVKLLSTLTGKDGEVEIPRFYDPIPPLSKDEKGLYQDITEALVQRNPELGDPRALAISLMRRWREASLTIHGFQTSGADNATIIPRLAKAAISMRLVPNQEAQEVTKALKTYLHAEFDKLGSNNNLTVIVDHQADPWLGDWTNEIFQTLEEAIMEVWGPIDQTRRRKSSVLPLRLSSSQPTRKANGHAHDPSGDYLTSKTSPTTSAVLATGSIDTPPQSLTPTHEINDLDAVNEVLDDAAVSEGAPTSPRRSQFHDRGPRTSKPRRKPLYIREGGSIPAIRFLEKEFNAPAAHLPCGQASDSAHLDNERLRLVNLYKSRDIFKKVFRELPQK